MQCVEKVGLNANVCHKYLHIRLMVSMAMTLKRPVQVLQSHKYVCFQAPSLNYNYGRCPRNASLSKQRMHAILFGIRAAETS